mmetsp:Transcript_3026/g.9055  ORF Transcript_3026/g.9055 Transcript_3026/m.9055 type:complete len:260 (+) Transcript_3026:118-897(+)
MTWEYKRVYHKGITHWRPLAALDEEQRGCDAGGDAEGYRCGGEVWHLEGGPFALDLAVLQGEPLRAVVTDAARLNGLGHGRVRVDNAAEEAEADLCLDSQRELGDHLAGVRRDDGRAEDFICALFAVDLDKAFVVALEDGAVDMCQRRRVRVALEAERGEVALVEADVGNLWLGERAPRDQQLGEFHVAAKERILHDGAGHGAGDVRELERRAAVADCVNVRVGRPARVVDFHPSLQVKVDARVFEAEALDVWFAARGD